MTDPNEVLGTFFGDESFPVEWDSEEEKKLFWFFDDNHVCRPISPMYWSLDGWWGPTLDYMYRRFGFPLGKAWIGKRVNGYLYVQGSVLAHQLHLAADSAIIARALEVLCAEVADVQFAVSHGLLYVQVRHDHCLSSPHH